MRNNLFDSLAGMIHYFVRPEDRFVLNSLEVLDSDEYLYRLLKKCGYERIVFFEDRGIGCKGFTYDELSNLSIKNSERFKDVNIHDEESVQNFLRDVRETQRQSDMGPKGLAVGTKKVQTVRGERMVPPYGKCDINLKSEGKNTFVSIFANHIVPALQAENIKTAIVMQLDLFDAVLNRNIMASHETSAQISGMMKDVMKHDTKQENIMVFTTTRKNDFIALLESRLLHNIHKQIPEIQGRGQECVEKIISSLEEQKCIVIADTIGEDEIANLIIRRKVIDKDSRYADIPISKVYGIARLLRQHLMKNSCNFTSIDYRRLDRYIVTLSNYLDKLHFIQELADISKKLEKDKILEKVHMDSVFVERVAHEYISFVEAGDEKDILAAFDELIGDEMQTVKQYVMETLVYLEAKRNKAVTAKKNGEKNVEMPYMNMRFLGAPGTGKTTVAKLVARLFHAKGILPTDRVETMDAVDAVNSHVGGTASIIAEAVERANGGVLVIDEFYGFDKEYQGGNIARDAMDAILSAVNKHSDTLCIIVCGYEKEVEKVLKANDGGERRFPHKVKFPDYSTDTLMTILDTMLAKDEKELADGVKEKLRKIIEADREIQGQRFGNAGYLKNMLGEMEKKYIARKGDDNIYRLEDVLNAFPAYSAFLTENNEKEEDILREFDEFVGMDYLKTQVKKVLRKFESDKKKYEEAIAAGNKPNKYPYMNMIFVGPPGTGKTTVADIVARLFCAKGILSNPEPVYSQPADFPSEGTVGMVGKKLGEALDRGNGGVFIIDEFYNFDEAYKDGNIAKEAFAAIMNRTDKYKSTMCLILCGYEDEMNKMFTCNRGAKRRFPYQMEFKSYSTDELVEIFRRMTKDKEIDDETMKLVRNVIEHEKVNTGEAFGNAGFIEDILIAKIDAEYLVRDEDDNRYTKEDVRNAFPDITYQ